jgi:protease-4
MKRFIKWVAIIFGILLIFMFITYLLIDALLDTEPIVSGNSYLQINLWGSLPEYEPPDAFEEYFRGSVLDLNKIRQSIKMAAIDDRINGIILEIGFTRIGFAQLSELHQLIKKFRLSGKKVLAHFDYGLTRDYLLATACDSIFISPGGNLFITGLSAEITFYKGLLNKLGIEADFEHVGKYKNAPDVYTRQSMSGPQREVVDEILDARYKEIISTIAENRHIDQKTVLHFIDNISGFSPEEAVKSELVDGIKYLEEVTDIFKNETEKISRISAIEYSRINPASVGLGDDERMAVIFCTGAMTGGEDGSDPVFGKTMGANRVIRNLKRASESKSVKAIILRINSPGGSSLAADKIWFAISEAAKNKPVVASISDFGASGGYYIAIGADTVISQKLSLIGSIGVYAGKFSIEKLYSKIALNNVVINRGKNAGLFSLNNTFTDSEREVIQRMIQDFYQKFVSKVADKRRKSYEQIDEIARGRVWDGETGMTINLIDIIGGMDEAIEVAKHLADIEDSADIQLIFYPRSRSFLDQFFNRVSVFNTLIENPFDQIEQYLKEIQLQPLMLMPFKMD